MGTFLIYFKNKIFVNSIIYRKIKINKIFFQFDTILHIKQRYLIKTN